jgi:tRNA pseudouridine55 synthase
LTAAGARGAVYLLDKGRDTTSRKAAREVAGALGFRKYGHAGTLDPDATGVLVVLLGTATRLSRFLAGHDKRYEFVLRLGVTTDTDDDTGRVTGESDATGITREEVTSVIDREFTGRFIQVAPRFSAVRVNGRRAFHAARSGDDSVEMPSRQVRAGDWSQGELDGCAMKLSVTVSAGTYVRGLARDIGASLGTGAIASGIRRTRSGWFGIDECSRTPDDPASLLDLRNAMRGYPEITVSGADLEGILHGRPMEADGEGTVRLSDGQGRLVAVGEGVEGTVRPVCVLEAAP